MALSKNGKIAAVAGGALVALFGYEYLKKKQALLPGGAAQKIPGKEAGTLPTPPAATSNGGAADKTQLIAYLATMSGYCDADIANAQSMKASGYTGMDDFITQFGGIKSQIVQTQQSAASMSATDLQNQIYQLEASYNAADTALGNASSTNAPTTTTPGGDGGGLSGDLGGQPYADGTDPGDTPANPSPTQSSGDPTGTSDGSVWDEVTSWF